MCARDEADRYLDLSLSALCPAVDEVFVYDDQSTDRTVEVARHHAAHVVIRPNAVPAFLEHEGRFRQAAWDAFCATIVPQPGDWVLAVDADEIVLAEGDPKAVLRSGAVGVARGIKIPEVFDVRDGTPYIRLDGQWGKIIGSRFFAYQHGGVFADKAMASGSEPTYVVGVNRQMLEGFWLLHLGYANPRDRAEKYARYSMRPGHADTHVASIVKEPDLARWNGPTVQGLHDYFTHLV